jgi:hypothetical protein
VPQRHRWPFIAARICASVGRGLAASSSDRDFLWLNNLLTERLSLELRQAQIHLWTEALRLSGGSRSVSVWTLACAIRAGNCDFAAKLALRLRANLSGLSRAPELYLPWCLMGDSALLNQDFEGAKAAYAGIVFTHVTDKLRANAHLGAPTVGLVNEAVTSFRHRLQVGREMPITVFYDYRKTRRNDEYRRNLEGYCEQTGLELIINQDNGLRRQWLDAFNRIEADVVAIIEQDHRFEHTCPTFHQILDLFNRRAEINYLRLNRKENLPVWLDHALSASCQDRTDGIVSTSRFSNTPHFLRRRFFDCVIRGIIEARPHYDLSNSGAGGVEENINDRFELIENRIGTVSLMRLAGMKVWGTFGAARLAVHLGN